MFCTLTQALIPFPLSRCQSPSRSAVVVELTCELQGNWEAPPIPQLQECIKPEECITRKRKQQEREMEERNSSEGTNPWLERTAWQPDRQPRAAGTAVSKATR
ncbi:unnamed protein product [Closterium sp. NIES-64]|nr:unnamed protein product [Closterium sp. NIES-64]